MLDGLIWLAIAWGFGFVGSVLAGLHAVMGVGLLALTGVLIAVIFKRSPGGITGSSPSSTFDVASTRDRCVLLLWLIAWVAGLCQGLWAAS